MKKIIHKIIKIYHNYCDDKHDLRYLCNQACGITFGKYNYRWKKVTCKNCLQHFKKGGK